MCIRPIDLREPLGHRTAHLEADRGPRRAHHDALHAGILRGAQQTKRAVAGRPDQIVGVLRYGHGKGRGEVRRGEVKITPYLYFETREEVLLALYGELLEAWVSALTERLGDGLSDEDFVEAFEPVSLADPDFLVLRARLESMIEHKMSVGRLVEARREMRDLVTTLAPRVEELLGIVAGRGTELLVSLAALQLSAAQSQMGPAATGLDLPDGVAELMRSHGEYDVLRETARMAVAGCRAASQWRGWTSTTSSSQGLVPTRSCVRLAEYVACDPRKTRSEVSESVLSELVRDPHELFEGLRAAPGEGFLRWLAAHLRRLSNADVAFVGELRAEDWERVRTVAVESRDGPQPGFEYELPGTPCESVIAGKACVFPNDVQSLFPEDTMLGDMGIESYVGMALLDSAGRPLGLLVLLSARSLSPEDCEHALGLLDVFRSRVEGEFVARRAVRELESVVESTGTSGEDTLQSLTLALARAMYVKAAFVCAKPGDDDHRMRTMALVIDGRIRRDFEFDCEGTPCQAAYESGDLFFPSGVRDAFPSDAILRGLEAEAYMAVVFRDEEGFPLGHLGLIHDRPLSVSPETHPLFRVLTARLASELKRLLAEGARIDAEGRLVESQRMESLGILAGGIAHDFNNLLVSILGNADIVESELGSGPLQPQVREIVSASERAAALCQELLVYAGRRSRQTEPLDLNALVSDAAALTAGASSSLIRVRRNLSPDLPAVDADPAQIHQVAMNLIGNAREAIGKAAGVVTLSTAWRHCSREELEVWPACGCLPEDRYVVLSVSDTGCGMDPKSLKRIFDPFFTSKANGRGLGLASVRGVVQSHRGAISVQSEPGRGTTFHVYLPAGQMPIRQPAADDEADTPTRSATVLVVDDDEGVRGVVRSMLEAGGFDVLTAAGGREAIRLLEAGDAIDCIILDLVMPEFGGEETLHELRRLGFDVPVLISSGNADPDLLTRFGPKDVAGLLHKPYRARKLIEKVRALLPDSGGTVDS
jgi:signal transduction histidine kinase/CheY-like chemotaxis protein/AcrR family transcriptional regulator